MKVADVLPDEQAQLMPVPRAFDDFVELLARVISTALIHLERNCDSVPTEPSQLGPQCAHVRGPH